MAQLAHEHTSHTDVWRGYFLKVAHNSLISAVAFVMMGSVMLYIKGKNDFWMPDELLADFAIIGVGAFFGNFVAAATYTSLKGYTRVRVLPIIFFAAAAAAAIV